MNSGAFGFLIEYNYNLSSVRFQQNKLLLSTGANVNRLNYSWVCAQNLNASAMLNQGGRGGSSNMSDLKFKFPASISGPKWWRENILRFSFCSELNIGNRILSNGSLYNHIIKFILPSFQCPIGQHISNNSRLFIVLSFPLLFFFCLFPSFYLKLIYLNTIPNTVLTYVSFVQLNNPRYIGQY